MWGRAKHILGPLFLTSGLSTGMACLSLLLSFGRHNQDTLERLERAEIIAMTTELGLISALPPRLGSLGKPLFTSKVGTYFGIGTIGAGLLLPLGIRLGWKIAKKPTPRSFNIGLSLLVLVGGMILRAVWIIAGRASADDSDAIHHYNNLEEAAREKKRR